MPVDPKIHEFIEQARAHGATDETVVGMLTSRGWPERDVYEALATRYEQLAGIQIPRRGGTATAAKDAFFYLLAFSTLATWTIGLGSLCFTLIDQWFADALFSNGYNQTYETSNIAAGMASVLIAFPIYLLVNQAILRDVRSHPEKLASSVRRWLTYMALVVAAGVFIGDLVTALTTLLRGEITSRFLAKAFVVLAISGGVFFYYYFGLKKPEDGEAAPQRGRDFGMAILSTTVVALTIALGFVRIGGPATQRSLRADEKRVQDLFQLSQKIENRWRLHTDSMPSSISEIAGAAIADPITRVAYEYHLKEGAQYELCATFSAASERGGRSSDSNSWSHPAGHHCFDLNATQATQPPEGTWY